MSQFHTSQWDPWGQGWSSIHLCIPPPGLVPGTKDRLGQWLMDECGVETWRKRVRKDWEGSEGKPGRRLSQSKCVGSRKELPFTAHHDCPPAIVPVLCLHTLSHSVLATTDQEPGFREPKQPAQGHTARPGMESRTVWPENLCSFCWVTLLSWGWQGRGKSEAIPVWLEHMLFEAGWGRGLGVHSASQKELLRKNNSPAAPWKFFVKKSLIHTDWWPPDAIGKLESDSGNSQKGPSWKVWILVPFSPFMSHETLVKLPHLSNPWFSCCYMTLLTPSLWLGPEIE